MYKLLSLTMLFSLILSACVLGTPVIQNDEAAAQKRTNSLSGSQSKRQKMSISEASLEIRIKKEPGSEIPTPLILSAHAIQMQLNKFNPQKGVNNCLECSTSFLRWIKTGVLKPAQKKAQGENFLSYERFGYLLQSTNTEHLAPAPVVIDISDANQFFEYIDVDKRVITFTPSPLNHLKNYLMNLPLLPAADGSYQAGIIYLHYKPDVKDPSIPHDGHFMNFYISQQASEKTLFMVDAQSREMQNIEPYLKNYAHLYESRAYVFHLSTTQNRPSAAIVKQEVAENSEPSLTQAQIISRIAQASAFINGRPVAITAIHAFEYLEQGLTSPSISQEMRDMCALRLAQMRYKFDITEINDETASLYLKQAIDSPDLKQQPKNIAFYLLALMRCEDRTTLMTYQEATRHLLYAVKNVGLSQLEKDNAVYRLALMHIKMRSKEITDQKAAEYFDQSRKSETLPRAFKEKATIYLCTMRLNNCTDIITPEEAMQFLENIIASTQDDPTKIHAQEILDNLRRVQSIKWSSAPTPVAAIKTMPKTTPSPKIPPLPRTHVPQYRNATTSSIFSEPAPFTISQSYMHLPENAVIIKALIKNPHLNAAQLAQAKYKLAFMRAHNRTDVIDDSKARKYLGQFLKLPIKKEDAQAVSALLKIFLNRM